jgi:hypothetical protein
MPSPKKPRKARASSLAKTEKLLRETLRAQQASAGPPVPPVEPLLEKWNAERAALPASDVLPIAARSGDALTPESRAKIQRMLGHMRESRKRHGR